MKTNLKSLFFVVIIAMFAAMALILGSCETIEIEKLIYDTVYVDKPIRSLVTTVHVDTVYKELLRVDTIEVQVIVHDSVFIVNNVETVRIDTVVQVKTDSVFIERVVEKTVNHYDTIVITNNTTDTLLVHDTIRVVEYEQIIKYLNTEFIYIFPGNSTTYIPEPYKPIHDQFIADAQARGKNLPGGDMVLMRVDPSELAGDNWTSDSWEVAGFQWVIRISDQLTVEQSKASIYRELGRIQLKKKYSNDTKRIMSPLFRTSPEPTSQEINQLFAQ